MTDYFSALCFGWRDCAFLAALFVQYHLSERFQWLVADLSCNVFPCAISCTTQLCCSLRIFHFCLTVFRFLFYFVTEDGTLPKSILPINLQKKNYLLFVQWLTLPRTKLLLFLIIWMKDRRSIGFLYQVIAALSIQQNPTSSNTLSNLTAALCQIVLDRQKTCYVAAWNFAIEVSLLMLVNVYTNSFPNTMM